MNKYIFSKKFFKKKNYNKIIEFLRHNCNAEVGGYKIHNGNGDHCLQCPEELFWLIKELKSHEKIKKFNSYLEFGYANGVTNTILNKFFNFNKIVAIDIVNPENISKNSFFANLRFKNFILLCGDSKSKFIKEQIKNNSKFDLMFIDGGHDYNTVNNDFNIAIENLNKNGIIIIHDIYASACDGPSKLWMEIKKNRKFYTKEYLCDKYYTQYGIGYIKI